MLAERPLRDKPHADTIVVEDLVKKFLAGQIRVPSFQRALKWGAKDVQRLLDSVYRGFPIGSLLMWKRPAEAQRVRIGPFDIEVVENEHAVMTWAAASGFEVPHFEIIDAGQMQGIPHQIHEDTPVYCVERFDRRGPERIHQEDLAQVLGVDSEDAVGSNVPFGYGGLGLIMGRLLGISGLDEYLRRIALIVASGNEDAHIKNWSIIYLVERALDGLRNAWRDVQDRIFMLPRHRQALAAHWQNVPLLRRMGALES